MTAEPLAYQWDSFEVRPGARTLRRGATEIRMEPKAYDVLVYLIRHRNRVVPKQELLDELWPGRVVVDATVNQCLLKIRQAIDGDQAASVIQTLRGRGYRFRADVRVVEEAPPARAGGGALADARPGLLVLPFKRLSADSEDAYIADSLTELLIATLAGIGELRVISRTSAMALGRLEETLPELAARVGARWVIEGSVLVAGPKLKVVAQLIDAHTDAHVWADTYRCDLRDLLELENDVAREIAGQVSGSMPRPAIPAELTGDQLRAFLRGRALLNMRDVENLKRARECFELITRERPTFSPAWGSLGEVHLLLAHYGAIPIAEAREQVRHCVTEALRLEPSQAIALACRGGLHFFFERDFDAAEKSTRRALTYQPNYDWALLTMANICSAQRRFEEARAWCRQALQVDPLNVGVNMNFADHLIIMGERDEAIEQLERTLTMSPAHLPSRLRLAWALALNGRAEAAADVLEQLRVSCAESPSLQEYAAMVAGLAGDASAARGYFDALRAQRAFVSPWALARAAAAAGLADEAFALLQQCLEAGSTSLPFLSVTPAFENLQADPRWPSLLAAARPS